MQSIYYLYENNYCLISISQNVICYILIHSYLIHSPPLQLLDQMFDIKKFGHTRTNGI